MIVGTGAYLRGGVGPVPPPFTVIINYCDE